MEKYLILLPIGLLTSVQLLLKWQAASHAQARISLLSYLVSLASSPWVWIAMAMAGLAFIAWMVVLKRIPLSFAYPFVSLTFPLVAIGSVFIFDEKVNPLQMVGLVLILAGVAMHVRFANS
jgi:multidrug transporter EmrE-like cation transporter